MGRGPSTKYINENTFLDIDDIILVNDHKKTVNNSKILKIIKNKKNYIISNIQQAGFNSEVLNKINVEACILNRLIPDDVIWQKNKSKQKKWSEGGCLNTPSHLPILEEDEPYLFSWRGPPGRNRLNMKTHDGREIEHMPEECEEYLIPVYRDKIICNCSYYASLYAILKLQATHIVYFGIDFYNHKKILKKWYTNPPSYLSSEWWDLRLKYEGEQMKDLWRTYLCKDFPEIKFEFYTTEIFETNNLNIILNTSN
jgi:hypothetical protein